MRSWGEQTGAPRRPWSLASSSASQAPISDRRAPMSSEGSIPRCSMLVWSVMLRDEAVRVEAWGVFGVVGG